MRSSSWPCTTRSPSATPRKTISPETSDEMGTSTSLATVPDAVTVCVIARTRASRDLDGQAVVLAAERDRGADDRDGGDAEADQDFLRRGHESGGEVRNGRTSHRGTGEARGLARPRCVRARRACRRARPALTSPTARRTSAARKTSP